jgi:hypothetical protein
MAARTRRLVPKMEMGLMPTPESARTFFLPPFEQVVVEESIRRAASALPCLNSMPA